LILLVTMAVYGSGQDYSYTLKKTMSPDKGRTDYTFWKFPVSSLSRITLVKGDTMDLTIAVDLAKDHPATPSLELKFANESGTTDSLFLSGKIEGSQFHLLTLEPSTAQALKTISSTRINMSSANPYYHVIADSVNTGGFVIPVTGVNHLRSVLYTIRLIPRGITDTVKVTGIHFKSWEHPIY